MFTVFASHFRNETSKHTLHYYVIASTLQIKRIISSSNVVVAVTAVAAAAVCTLLTHTMCMFVLGILPSYSRLPCENGEINRANMLHRMCVSLWTMKRI